MKTKSKPKSKLKSKKTLYIYGAIAILAILVSIAVVITRDSDTQQSSFVVPPLTEDYSNPVFGFSFKIPEDFKTRESVVDDTHTIVLENQKAEGIQIVVSRYDDSTKILTADMIRESIPDMKVYGEEVLEIGESHRGVAFKSDNEAFDGASREVWFVFRGNLYQISTYERFDELLKKMFGTWKFE